MSSPELVGQLKSAIDANNLERVKALTMGNPELHRAPLGYANDGPLTWVAECRVPYEPPGPERLAMAQWMIANGSDVHQGGDGPLMRAALNGDRVAMMELLVAHGANVNAAWHGNYPIIFGPCETVDPVALKWLLEHGADPNRGDAGTALDYLIGSYVRNPESLSACINILLDVGASTKYDLPGVLAVLRGRSDQLREQLEFDPELVTQRFHALDFGTTGARMLTLAGATLLHVASEYGNLQAVELLIERGGDVNAPATVNDSGVGGQTAIFHAATQFGDAGPPVVELLLQRGADLSISAKPPGHYEQPGEVVECTPLGYALLFPGVHGETVKLLRAHGAPE